MQGPNVKRDVVPIIRKPVMYALGPRTYTYQDLYINKFANCLYTDESGTSAETEQIRLRNFLASRDV